MKHNTLYGRLKKVEGTQGAWMAVGRTKDEKAAFAFSEASDA